MEDLSLEPPPRERKILFQTDAFEVVAIEWVSGAPSFLHDHGWSQCYVMIEEGIFENTLDLGAKTEVRRLEKGEVVATPVGSRHEMRCESATGKTLHVYTPRLTTVESERFQGSLSAVLKEQIILSAPTSIEALRVLLSGIERESISTHSPYFMNQLFAGVHPQILLAEDLLAKAKTTLATFEASPVFSAIEAEVVEALGRAIGWGAGERSGIAVPGGSAANFMALHCAREHAFPGAKSGGAPSAKLQVFVSEEAHYSFKKACAVLGVGTDNLVVVASDSRARMRAPELDRLLTLSRENGAVPLMVAATSGTTVRGSFDELPLLAEICGRHKVWLHADAAWGGPALFSSKLRHLVQGIDFADSVTFDAHKLFGASVTSSFFLTRHERILLEANDVAGGDYLFHAADPNLDRGRLSWQCGRGADAFSFWTIWKSLGTEGLGVFVERLISIREESTAWIEEQPRLELIGEPDYLNLCVRVRPPVGVVNKDWSRVVREQLKNENRAMVNFSANAEGSFLRLILAHPYLTFAHVQQILTWALEVNA